MPPFDFDTLITADNDNTSVSDLCDDCLMNFATDEYALDGLISVDVACELFLRGVSVNDVIANHYLNS